MSTAKHRPTEHINKLFKDLGHVQADTSTEGENAINFYDVREAPGTA